MGSSKSFKKLHLKTSLRPPGDLWLMVTGQRVGAAGFLLLLDEIFVIAFVSCRFRQWPVVCMEDADLSVNIR